MAWILPIAKQNKVTTIVGHLIMAASSYFVWQERNNRLHGKGDRHPNQVSKIVIDTVRLKLATIQFKKSVKVEHMRRIWKITSNDVDGD